MGMVLMTGSIPFSISDPDVPPFANPNVVTHMSETAIDVLDNLPKPKSENERKEKFDVGFYNLIQQKIQDKPEIHSCVEKLGNLPYDSIPSKSENPQNSKFIDVSEIILNNPFCENHLISEKNMTISEISDNANFHSIVVLLKQDNSEDPHQKLVQGNSRAELHKLTMINHLDNLEAKNIFKGQNLSFVIATVPLENISKLSDNNYLSLIGDGERKLDLMLEFTKNIVFAENPEHVSETGDGVIVALIDSGIRQDHDDLFPPPNPPTNEVVIDQIECAENIFGTLECPKPNPDFSDSLGLVGGHGTSNAGIIAGQGTINSDRIGLAPDAKIFNIKIPSVPSTAEFGAALDWAVTNQARVVNLSFGDDALVGQYPIDSLIADEAADLGAVIVASAGNTGLLANPNVTPPGTGFNVLAVGNMVDDRIENTDPSSYSISSTSSRGPLDDDRLKPDLVAPGTSIQAPDGGFLFDYSANTGTSHSAPFVSGASALLLEAHPEFTPLEVKGTLIAGADWRGPTSLYSAVSYDAGSDQANVSEWGFGMLNVEKSLDLAGDGDKIIMDVIEEESTISKEYSISVTDGVITKIFLTWFLNPSGTIENPSIEPIADFTLELRDSTNGLITTSDSDIQNTEFIIFTPSETSSNYKLVVTAEDNFSPPDTFHSFVLASTNPITPLQSLHCMPSDSTPYDWIVDDDCTLATDKIINGNVIIENNSSLIVPNGLSLDVDFQNKHVLIKDGGELIIKNGGKVT